MPEYEDRDWNENRKEHNGKEEFHARRGTFLLPREWRERDKERSGGRGAREKEDCEGNRIGSAQWRVKSKLKALRSLVLAAFHRSSTYFSTFRNALRFLFKALTTLRAPRSSREKKKVEKLRRTREPSAPGGPSSRSQLLLDRSSDQSPVILNYLADAPFPPDGETSPNVSSGKFPPHDRKLIRPRRVWSLMNVDPTRADASDLLRF